MNPHGDTTRRDEPGHVFLSLYTASVRGLAGAKYVSMSELVYEAVSKIAAIWRVGSSPTTGTSCSIGQACVCVVGNSSPTVISARDPARHAGCSSDVELGALLASKVP